MRSHQARSWRVGNAAVQVSALSVLLLLWLVPAFVPTARAATVNVSIVELAFQPSTINVQLLDTVVWTNNGDLPHTVTSDGGAGPLSSSTLNTGGTYSFTFTSEGTFDYHCTFHPSMTGSVVVGTVIPEFPSTAFVVIGLMTVLLVFAALGRRD